MCVKGTLVMVTCSLASWVILATILLYGSTILLRILEKKILNQDSYVLGFYGGTV